MVLELVLCLSCGSEDIVKHGQLQAGSATNVQMQSVLAARLFEVIAIEAICRKSSSRLQGLHSMAIALNGSGIRDTACVLKISSTTVIETLKSPQLKAVIEARLLELEPTQTVVCLCQWEAIEAELDEM